MRKMYLHINNQLLECELISSENTTYGKQSKSIWYSRSQVESFRFKVRIKKNLVENIDKSQTFYTLNQTDSGTAWVGKYIKSHDISKFPNGDVITKLEFSISKHQNISKEDYRNIKLSVLV